MILGILFSEMSRRKTHKGTGQYADTRNRKSAEESFMQEFDNQKCMENIRKRLQNLLWLYPKGVVGYGSDKYMCLARCQTGVYR